MNRLRVVVMLVAALVNCGRASGRDETGAGRSPEDRQGVTRKPQDRLAALYVGTSSDAIAWLLTVDTASASGTLFDPLGPIPLCGLRVDSEARKSFTSPELSDGTIYRFVGRMSTTEIEGVLEHVAARSGRVRKSSTLALRRVRLRGQSGTASRLPSGVYGNVMYHQQTGDLLGNELVLIDGEDGTVVLTIEYGGAPDWPRMAQRAKLRGDSLAVWTKYPVRGDTADAGLVKGDTIQFGPDFKMVRKATLEEFLTQPSRYRCP